MNSANDSFDDLDALDSAWGGTKAAEGKGADTLPDGRYQAKLHSCELKRSKDDGSGGGGKPMFSMCFEVLNGPMEGKKFWKNAMFTPEAMPYTKADLTMLGFSGNLSDLKSIEVRARLLDRRVECNLKSRQQGDRSQQQVFINKSLDGTPAMNPANTGGVPAGQPAPNRPAIGSDEPPF